MVMAQGGARARSGPAPDPNSGRSDRRGLKFTALPAEGYQGDVPDFPLPGLTPREAEVWETLWRTPQAEGWSRQSWRWPEIGQFARLSVRLEAPDAPASLMTPWLRIRTELGLSPAGLKENGWQIEAVEVGGKPAGKPAAESSGSRARLEVLTGGRG